MSTGAVRLKFKRILLTGADGFVGPYLLHALRPALADDARIVLATRTPQVQGGDQQVLLDLLDPRTVSSAVTDVAPDLVIHLAAQSSVAESGRAAEHTWKVNLGGSLALAEAVAKAAPTAIFFFCSTAEVYGATFKSGVVTEDSCLRPQSTYARSKAAAEAMLTDVLPSSAKLVIVRPSNHTGRGQDQHFVIPAFASQIARVEKKIAPPEIRVGNLAAERDFMDVRDVVNAYVALIGATERLPRVSVFNIASGRLRKIGDLLDRLRALSPTTTSVVIDPDRLRPVDVPQAAIDAAAIRALTGWQPTFSIDETLRSVLEAQREDLQRVEGEIP